MGIQCSENIIINNTYHSNIIIKYKLGLLDSEIIRKIPSSTRHNWKKYNLGRLFGHKDTDEPLDNPELMKAMVNKKYILKAVKALLYINNIYRKILDTVKHKYKCISDAKDYILMGVKRFKAHLGTARLIRWLPISIGQYYQWLCQEKKCSSSALSLCRNIYPNQLTVKELGTIKRFLKKPEYLKWPLNSVYYMALRKQKIAISLSTWYNYVKALNLGRSLPPNRRKKHDIGLRAEGAKKIIHADMTIFRPLDHSRVYIYLIVDNFSRFILACQVSLEYSAKIMLKNLKKAMTRYKLKSENFVIEMITDDGSENKGPVMDYVNNTDNNINKVIALKDIVFSNSMVEAANQKLKYQYLFRKTLYNFKQTWKYLPKAVRDYNDRPSGIHYGLTPREVFLGALTDRNKFTSGIAAARKERIRFNQGYDCCNG